MFEQEAVRLDDLGKHPQIPELLAHCEQDGRQYLVQEFIDGENLLQELKREGRFSEAKIKDLLLDLLPVLQFIHAGNVIHRDIKPENIIRRRSDGKLVLVDFGAAKMATKTALTKTGTMIGSAEYTAPEQARGKAVFASDIYALGVSCIYLLTQIPPFDLFSDHEDAWVWRQFLNGNVVSNELGSLVDRMLAKALTRRYQTSAEVLQILQLSPSSQSKSVSPKANHSIPSTVKAQPAKPSFLSGIFGVKPSQPSESFSRNLILECGNGINLEMVRIKSGSFNMGSDYSSESPIHQVNMQGFYIGKYPVTQSQYQAIIGKNPSKLKDPCNPAENINWNDAVLFCEKLSQVTGKEVRLPSEAEWEYACRSGSKWKYCFGSNVDKLKDYAWYDKNSGDRPHPVGEKLPNAWGLYDMHGNVKEWCEDVWHDNYNGAPNDGRARLTGGEQRRRVLRGGAWFLSDFACRSANREKGIPGNKEIWQGFRVVV
ncbi:MULTISPECIES: bifunctional serine/threonine-protein kinase/formylglycine-generating enzyme family protein [Pseudanabaena]|uniref:Serine/threonine protein kinase n=2 Tax=Pseudanabaena TaxID=1152 RepID=L8N204_9CYAN|nr:MULTISPECIES: bifunctional serine/threonine-protein kinase/formylglycine-generating enzyme family protein [Pseudanabaena]ELS33736.1 serine/threonine protein kinase [Pseudanabaena biceps PCC 7429]MDG3494071.1 bifunctional serine/threonine-protein kinase/formylglycine-generating enzyme family protein [Pseudanabaena catenata USMAC16]